MSIPKNKYKKKGPSPISALLTPLDPRDGEKWRRVEGGVGSGA